mgnify:CR=1 FL=1
MAITHVDSCLPENHTNIPSNNPANVSPASSEITFGPVNVIVTRSSSDNAGAANPVINSNANTTQPAAITIQEPFETIVPASQSERVISTSPANTAGSNAPRENTEGNQSDRANTTTPRTETKENSPQAFIPFDSRLASAPKRNILPGTASNIETETPKTPDDRVLSYPAYGEPPRFPTQDDFDPNAYGVRTMRQTIPIQKPTQTKGHRSTSVLMDEYKFQSKKPKLLLNDRKILDGLHKIRDKLYREIEKSGSEEGIERKKRILLRLETFIPNFEILLIQIRNGEKAKDKKFNIAYIALLELVNPDNNNEYGRGQPFKKVDEWGNVTWGEGVTNQCNHFVYDTIEKATLISLFGVRVQSYGMLGAGEYFQNNDVEHLSSISEEGKMGDIVSFGKEDIQHPDSLNNPAYNHVGIYLGDGLYLSATGDGSTPFDNILAVDRISIADVSFHAHFREVK